MKRTREKQREERRTQPAGSRKTRESARSGAETKRRNAAGGATARAATTGSIIDTPLPGKRSARKGSTEEVTRAASARPVKAAATKARRTRAAATKPAPPAGKSKPATGASAAKRTGASAPSIARTTTRRKEGVKRETETLKKETPKKETASARKKGGVQSGGTGVGRAAKTASTMDQTVAKARTKKSATVSVRKREKRGEVKPASLDTATTRGKGSSRGTAGRPKKGVSKATAIVKAPARRRGSAATAEPVMSKTRGASKRPKMETVKAAASKVAAPKKRKEAVAPEPRASKVAAPRKRRVAVVPEPPVVNVPVRRKRRSSRAVSEFVPLPEIRMTGELELTPPKWPNARFRKGQRLRMLHYLAPLPRGATVYVLDIEPDEEDINLYRYLVEGQSRGQAIEVWTVERDLDLPFLD